MVLFSKSRRAKEIQSLEMRWLPRQGHVVNVEINKLASNDDIWLVRKYYIRRFLSCYPRNKHRSSISTFVNKETETQEEVTYISVVVTNTMAFLGCLLWISQCK